MKYRITNTTTNDLNFIYWLFQEAIAYQKGNNYTVWKGYDKLVIVNDIKRKLQYKVLIKEMIACIFTIYYSDKIIWSKRDVGNALYIHRMVVNPNFKGQNMFSKIFKWSKDLASQKGLKFIRMDTWTNNPKLIAYYESFGLKNVGSVLTKDNSDLPIQHRNISLVLLEYNLCK